MGAIAFGVPRAGADPEITFNLDKADLMVRPVSEELAYIDVYNVKVSDIEFCLEDPDAVPPAVPDSVTLEGQPDRAFLLTLKLSKISVGNWAAEGTLKVADATAATKVVARFQSRYVSYGPGGTYAFDIGGYLCPDEDNHDAILVGTGEDWVFKGSGPIWPPDEDGQPDTITIPHARDGWDGGTLTTVRAGSLNPETIELFLTPANATTYPGAQVQGTIVPAPAAFGLGLVGLALAGYWMRRFA
jgi:hypothetical protein